MPEANFREASGTELTLKVSSPEDRPDEEKLKAQRLGGAGHRYVGDGHLVQWAFGACMQLRLWTKDLLPSALGLVWSGVVW